MNSSGEMYVSIKGRYYGMTTKPAFFITTLCRSGA